MSRLAELQEKVREYVAILQTVKKQRQETKILNDTLKGIGHDITQMLLDQEVTSCASMGYTFSVKEKAKLKSVTANRVVQMVQEHFQIPHDEMESFQKNMEAVRQQTCEYVNTLECKPTKVQKKAQDHHPSSVDGSPDSRLSTALDDLYT